MSDYEDEYYQPEEREVEYRDEDDERGYERYESPPRSPARSSSSSSGGGRESRHSDSSEEDGGHSDGDYRPVQGSVG